MWQKIYKNSSYIYLISWVQVCFIECILGFNNDYLEFIIFVYAFSENWVITGIEWWMNRIIVYFLFRGENVLCVWER